MEGVQNSVILKIWGEAFLDSEFKIYNFFCQKN